MRPYRILVKTCLEKVGVEQIICEYLITASFIGVSVKFNKLIIDTTLAGDRAQQRRRRHM
jgi:hypothetical protein